MRVCPEHLLQFGHISSGQLSDLFFAAGLLVVFKRGDKNFITHPSSLHHIDCQHIQPPHCGHAERSLRKFRLASEKIESDMSRSSHKPVGCKTHHLTPVQSLVDFEQVGHIRQHPYHMDIGSAEHIAAILHNLNSLASVKHWVDAFVLAHECIARNLVIAYV